jgi:hypothetical protein
MSVPKAVDRSRAHSRGRARLHRSGCSRWAPAGPSTFADAALGPGVRPNAFAQSSLGCGFRRQWPDEVNWKQATSYWLTACSLPLRNEGVPSVPATSPRHWRSRRSRTRAARWSLPHRHIRRRVARCRTGSRQEHQGPVEDDQGPTRAGGGPIAMATITQNRTRGAASTCWRLVFRSAS